jgi:hypothetical protein
MGGLPDRLMQATFDDVNVFAKLYFMAITNIILV